MAELRELSVNQFVEETASKGVCTGRRKRVGDGGGAGRGIDGNGGKSDDRKGKICGVQEEMQALAAEGAALHEELLAGIKKDSESFNGYMRALKLPKETEEEKKSALPPCSRG